MLYQAISCFQQLYFKNMKENKKIVPIIYRAIDIMKKCMGDPDLEIEILSKEMYRKPADKYAKAGRLGVDIKICGLKTFMGCESMAEEIACTPFGDIIAKEFVMGIIRTGYPEVFKIN